VREDYLARQLVHAFDADGWKMLERSHLLIATH
jgi:hypothetical protein